LCEGGDFDFRTCAAVFTKIDSQQQDLFWRAFCRTRATAIGNQIKPAPLKIVKDGPPGEISTSPLVIAADYQRRVARPRKVTFR